MTVVVVNTVTHVVKVAGGASVLVVAQQSVNVVTAGQQGPAGPGGNARYEHQQPSAAATWTVNHNLGYRPKVQPLSVGGMEMLAEVLHASGNQALVYFDAPVAGVAVCS